MSVESDIRTFLVSKAALTALVSTRIYGIFMPEDPVYPNILYTLISRDPASVMDGAATLVRDRWTFEIRAATYGEVIDVEEQLRAALDSAVRPTDGFVSIFLDTVDVSYEFTIEKFRRVCDYAIWSRP